MNNKTITELLNTKDIIEYISNLSIQELEDVIKYSADKYYNTGVSVISDSIYDMLIDYLKNKSPKSKVLTTIGAKVKNSSRKVKLDYWLGSMDKIKPPSNQLSIWLDKYKPPYNLSDKLDGISALLVYRNNKKINMYTRGTATEGLDITNLIKYLDLPNYDTVNKYCKKYNINTITPHDHDQRSGENGSNNDNLIAFRGELIINDEIFNKKWSTTFKNGRNAVAGLVNSKTINPDFAADVELVLYEVVDPFYPILDQFKIIKKLGFNIVYNRTTTDILTFENLSEYLKERRTLSKYLIDGIIVTSVNNIERNVKGNPEYAFAFKDVLEDQMAQTKILSIEWNISKAGYIIPTLLLEPVSIGGVEIKRATGNNAKFIVDNKLGTGAVIEIIRSGDVIPKVTKVIKGVKVPELPKNIKWVWNDTNVDIILEDSKGNKNVLIKSIYFFFSTLDTKGLGERNIEKIVNSGLDNIIKIITAKPDDLLKVEGFKEKTVNNIINSIKSSLQDIPLYKLMAASGTLGYGLGQEKFKLVLNMYPDLLNNTWTKNEFIDKIILVNSWDEKTATLFVNNFKDFIKFYNSIKPFITLKVEKKIKKNWISGLTFVMSGFRDDELKNSIESFGGKVSTSVSKNTDYLIVKEQSNIDNPTDKIKKALDLKINIITKNDLLKKI
jgi:DNA ligase (NAD+)